MIDDARIELGDDSTFLLVAKEIVYSHHEWWNGRGYPLGLAGEDIPLAGRIMAVSDVYDALVSDRPYKKAFTHEQAMKIMREESGTHFDPRLLSIIDNITPEFAEVSFQINDEAFALV